MSLQTLSEWLRCPNCFLPLSPHEPLTLTCESGHSFDVNKRGFVTLLKDPHKFLGDSAVMLDARDRFLAAGWYAPLRDALAAVVAAEAPVRLLDVGCGTGYYLRGVLPDSPDARALAMDLSPVAVARTVRSKDHVDGLVADVWSPLPVRSGAAGLILNVFAPRNAAEFHRILQPDGLLLVAVPRPTHLKELRAAGLALDVQPDKATHLTTSLAAYFSLEARQSLSRELLLSPTEVAALVGMGPSAHHSHPAILATESDPRRSVTAAFDLFSFRRRTLAPR